MPRLAKLLVFKYKQKKTHVSELFYLFYYVRLYTSFFCQQIFFVTDYILYILLFFVILGWENWGLGGDRTSILTSIIRTLYDMRYIYSLVVRYVLVLGHVNFLG